MKKLHMIIGKKQIIIASLVLILGVAIYLNWQFASSEEALTVADVLGSGSSSSMQTTSTPTYGEAELVSNNNVGEDDYFTQARLDKQRAEDEAADALSTALNSGTLSSEEMENATQQSMQLAQMASYESDIENQVKAKGFADCVAYVEADRVNVTVKADDLDASQAAQIKDIIVSTTGVDPSSIVVTPVK